MSNSLWPHELQHTRPPCPSPTPGVQPNPCPLSQWCHPTISSFVVPFSSCPQSFPASRAFQMSQLFASGDQSIGISASTSVLPMNTQEWSPLGWTGWISLQSKELSRVFSNTTVQKHRFFGAQLSLIWFIFYKPLIYPLVFHWVSLVPYKTEFSPDHSNEDTHERQTFRGTGMAKRKKWRIVRNPETSNRRNN